MLFGTVDLVDDSHTLGGFLYNRQQFDEIVDQLPDHGSLDRQGLVRPTDIGGDEHGEADESVEVLLAVQGIARAANRFELGLQFGRIGDRIGSEFLQRRTGQKLTPRSVAVLRDDHFATGWGVYR